MSLLQEKATIAASSARLLLQAGDHYGAINRAYFAMFHAARFALTGINSKLAAAKTHKSVIGGFALHFVKERGVDKQFGRMFSEAQALRETADYDLIPIGLHEADKLVADMETFLAALQTYFPENAP